MSKYDDALRRAAQAGGFLADDKPGPSDAADELCDHLLGVIKSATELVGYVRRLTAELEAAKLKLGEK